MDGWTNLEQLPRGEDVPSEVDLQSVKTSEIAASFFELLSLSAFRRLRSSSSPVFYVDLGIEPVYTTFLTHLRPNSRSLHLCSICQSFANRYGKLALVKDDGTLVPVLWSNKDLHGRDMQEAYGPSVKAVQRRFNGKKVSKDFNVEGRPGFSRMKTLGTIAKDGFPHMYLQQPDSRVHKHDRSIAKAASVSEQAAMLDQLLTNYSVQTIRKANWILQNNKLPLSHNHKSSCQWLLDLVEQETIGRAHGAVSRHNLLYRYSADLFIASRKDVKDGALNLLLENIQNNIPWPTVLAEWLWVCGRAEFVRHNFMSMKGKARPADFFHNRLGHHWQFPRHRLCVQADVPESAVIWAPGRISLRGNDDAERPDKEEVSEGVTDEGDEALTISAPGAKVPSTNNSKRLMRRNNASCLVPNPSQGYGTMDITLSDFITRILPDAKHVAYCHLPWDRIVTFITGMDDPKPLQEWDPRDDQNAVSAFVTLDAKRAESTSEVNGEDNSKAYHWINVCLLITFPDLWDDMAHVIKPPLTEADTGMGSDPGHSETLKRLRYLFVLEGIHKFNLSDMPSVQEDQVRYMQGDTNEGFVGGVSIDRATIANGPAPSFMVVTSRAHTKVFRIRDFA